jgi:SAM-dependent methyltransferase
MDRPAQAAAFPLDLARTAYSYVERPNPAIQALVAKHVLSQRPDARILDIGCGCGANARGFKEQSGAVRVTGIEPNDRACELSRATCDDVFQGTLQEWAASAKDAAPFDALLLSDVLEHVADPVAFVREITAVPALRRATWIVSVPNYAVWYNRMFTVLGVQAYGWSGLWDRTHLRFYTRRTARELLEYCGLSVLDMSSTPSLVQSTAPILRKLFERDVKEGDHLALVESPAFRLYRKVVEPVESRVCDLWPSLLGFQVVFAARSAL